MSVDAAQTEELIKEKARYLFFQKGLLNATTQEIADAANVNRALIHYYFRSREHMLEVLLEESIQEKRERIRNILSSVMPFHIKIARYIDTLIELGLRYPYLESFIIHETARNPDKVRLLCARDRVKTSALIHDELGHEISAGRIAPISAEQFMANLVSLTNYPFLAKGVFQTIHGMSDTAYRKFLIERKAVIYRAIFGADMPEDALQGEHKTKG